MSDTKQNTKMVGINENSMLEQINNLKTNGDNLVNILESIAKYIQTIVEDEVWTGDLANNTIYQISRILAKNVSVTRVKLEEYNTFLNSVVANYEKADSYANISSITTNTRSEV